MAHNAFYEVRKQEMVFGASRIGRPEFGGLEDWRLGGWQWNSGACGYKECSLLSDAALELVGCLNAAGS